MSKSKKDDPQFVPWFEIDQVTLVAALEQLAPFAQANRNFAAMGYVLVETRGNELHLRVGDGEAGIALTLSLDTLLDQPPMALGVSHKMLLDWVKTQTERLSFTLNETTTTVMVKVARTQAKFKGMLANDCLAALPVPTGATVQLDATMFAATIARVAFAAATEGSRPVLLGIHLRLAKGALTLSAADGFRLAREQLILEGVDSSLVAEGLVSASVVQRIAKIAGKVKGSLTLTLDEARTHARFQLDGIDIVTTQIDGQYPDLDRVIPAKTVRQAVFNLEWLQASVKTACCFNRTQLDLAFDGQTVTVSGVDAETGDLTGAIPLLGEQRLDPHQLKLSSSYLSQALDAARHVPVPVGEEGRVTFAFNPASRAPLVLRVPTVPDWLYVVMPMGEK